MEGSERSDIGETSSNFFALLLGSHSGGGSIGSSLETLLPMVVTGGCG